MRVAVVCLKFSGFFLAYILSVVLEQSGHNALVMSCSHFEVALPFQQEVVDALQSAIQDVLIFLHEHCTDRLDIHFF